MENLGYYNGKFDLIENMTVPMNDRACYFGDGLYESGLAAVKWIDELQEKYPNLIIENCSSGGMRADYMQLQHYSVQSTTDVWDNKFMVQLAAAAPTGVLPEQACVWCLPKPEFSDMEIASTIVNAMFRRVHLSGKTAWLSDGQKAMLHEGIRVYKATRHLVDKLTPFYPLGIPSADTDAKLQCAGFKNDENCFVTLTNLGDEQTIKVPLNFTPEKAEILYPASIPCPITTEEKSVNVSLKTNQAVVIKLK